MWGSSFCFRMFLNLINKYFTRSSNSIYRCSRNVHLTTNKQTQKQMLYSTTFIFLERFNMESPFFLAAMWYVVWVWWPCNKSLRNKRTSRPMTFAQTTRVSDHSSSPSERALVTGHTHHNTCRVGFASSISSEMFSEPYKFDDTRSRYGL